MVLIVQAQAQDLGRLDQRRQERQIVNRDILAACHDRVARLRQRVAALRDQRVEIIEPGIAEQRLDARAGIDCQTGLPIFRNFSQTHDSILLIPCHREGRRPPGQHEIYSDN